MLPKRTVLRNPLQINMYLSIGDIYLKEVRTLLIVRMLTLKFQSLSKSILANKVSLPAIIVESLGTSSHTILRSVPRSLGSRRKSQTHVSLALNLPCPIVLLCKSGNFPKGNLSHAITMARLATRRPDASS